MKIMNNNNPQEMNDSIQYYLFVFEVTSVEPMTCLNAGIVIR